MATQIDVSAGLLDYVRDVSLRDNEILAELRAETAELPGGTTMQVTAEEGQFLALLARLVRASSVLEIGTFTGYSTLCLAAAVPPGGRVVTCDITRRWPMIGEPYWARAGVAERIDLRIGDASQTLRGLIDEDGPGSFDFVFIDADKTGYAGYYEHALELVRPGGLIVIDNTLFSGRVADPAATDPDTEAIRALNLTLRDDERVDVSLVPVADGVTLVRKRPAGSA